MGGEVVAGGSEGGGGFGGEDEELVGPGGGFGRSGGRGFLQHDVGIGAADAKTADAGAEGGGAGPCLEFVDNVEGAVFQVQRGIGTPEMESRGKLAVVEGQGGFDEASDTGGGVHVAGVGFEGAQAAEVFASGAQAEGLGEAGDLDRIADGGGGAVAFDVGNGVRIDVGKRLGEGDDFGVAVDAGGSEAGFSAAVIVEGGALDDSPDVVALPDGVFEALEENDAESIGEDGAAGVGIVGAAVAVRRVKTAFLGGVAAVLRPLDADASGEGGVAGVGLQGLDGLADRHERGGARGVDIQSWAAEVEFISRAGGEVVLFIGDHGALITKLGAEFRIGQDLVLDPRTVGHAGVDADGAGVTGGVAAGVFEGVLAGLEEEALLGVDDFGFARIDIEESGIKPFRFFEDPAAGDVVRVEFVFLGGDLFDRDGGDGFAAGGEIFPEGAEGFRSGKTPGHADDGDAFEGGGGSWRGLGVGEAAHEEKTRRAERSGRTQGLD